MSEHRIEPPSHEGLPEAVNGLENVLGEISVALSQLIEALGQRLALDRYLQSRQQKMETLAAALYAVSLEPGDTASASLAKECWEAAETFYQVSTELQAAATKVQS